MSPSPAPALMPAEWEPHAATWIAWPHQEPDWPGKFEPIRWVYAEIVRLLAGERVEIICADQDIAAQAAECLKRTGVDPAGYRLHLLPTDRTWLRDSAPTAVRRGGRIEWVQWAFNGWAKYDNYAQDANVPGLVARVSGLPVAQAARPESGVPLVLEGGAIETDGQGTLLVTEECLLSDVQTRNPGLDRAGYEEAFRTWLGIERVIWLDRGCAGDDTHGHIDDIARFVGPAKVVLACEDDPSDENYASSQENLRRLRAARTAQGQAIEVVPIAMPRAVIFDGQRLPASYANFYITNRRVLVPTFNDPADARVLTRLAQLFPGREVVGVHSLELVWGLGTLHCLSQQQPA